MIGVNSNHSATTSHDGIYDQRLLCALVLAIILLATQFAMNWNSYRIEGEKTGVALVEQVLADRDCSFFDDLLSFESALGWTATPILFPFVVYAIAGGMRTDRLVSRFAALPRPPPHS